MPQQILAYTDKNNDKRRKLTDTERETIKELYKHQGATLRGLGRQFGVDRHTIKAIVDPIWYKNKQEQRYNKKPWLDYYDKERRREDMRKHRARKRKLGLLTKGDAVEVMPDEATGHEASTHFVTNLRTLINQVPSKRIGRVYIFKIEDLNEWNDGRQKHYRQRPMRANTSGASRKFQKNSGRLSV